MKQKPIILRNAAAETPELWFYQEFGPECVDGEYTGCISANGVRYALDCLRDAKKINVHMNTTGGDVFEAAAIYNLLKNFAAKKIGYIDGMAISCGSWVIQACDEIHMAENAMAMVHDPETCCYGNEAALLRDAAMLKQVKMSIVSTYASRSNKWTVDQFSAAMAAETWFTAQEAFDAGLVDVIDPNKSVTMSYNPRRFKNAPDWIANKLGNSDEWKAVVNSRRQMLNELEAIET